MFSNKQPGTQKKAENRQTLHGDARVMRKPLSIIAMRHLSTDPNGSYTGVCRDKYETPTQDADDL